MEKKRAGRKLVCVCFFFFVLFLVHVKFYPQGGATVKVKRPRSFLVVIKLNLSR